jgi:polyisoprenyl-phosphate glycosyltransferase
MRTVDWIMTKANTEISVVIPVYKGADYLLQLLESIDEVRSHFIISGLPIELSQCICVNDQAVDHSLEILRSAQQTRPWMTVLTLSRNFGQHPATVAGIQQASGDWVVTLDEDLQHDPRQIVSMLMRACERQCDVVYGRSDLDTHRSLYRNSASKWAKRSVAWLAGSPFMPIFSSFRVMRGSIARAAASSCSTETYFDVALTWFTQSMQAFALEFTDRRTGSGQKSGYAFMSLVRHAIRLLITSDLRILRFGSRLGFAGTVVGAMLVVVILILKLAFPNSIQVEGWASVMIMMLILNGLVALQCGIAVKYLSLVLQKSQGRPTYFVVDRSGDASLLVVLQQFLEFMKTQSTPASSRSGQGESSLE